MANIPRTFRKLVVRKLSTNFREAVTIETVEMCEPKENEICVKNRYVGINANDVNITKGRVFVDGKLPFDIGFEGVGEIVSTGSGITDLTVGDAVAYITSKRNTYAEYCCVDANEAFKVPKAKPEYIVLLVSGLTASIGLEKAGRIMNGETVLITAAAGGAGHIAVQWAKAEGCNVIATCSTRQKEKILKGLGCDTVINYRKENLAEVLAKEYTKGIDVIWETIGGEVFETCLKNLGVKGRLLVIGGISGYKEEEKKAILPTTEISWLPEMLLLKSATVQGFMLLHYRDCFRTYFTYLLEDFQSRKLKVICDFGIEKELVGLEKIINGVEYLHRGKSIGKVMVKISE